ncbi:MAG: right-handed parallel beta-helix repeat-containing protein, partial [Thermoplasmata archaeon]|nr:right-handed parallel beta-helix repeat-containing protein [Thermoplasmata archaeon]
MYLFFFSAIALAVVVSTLLLTDDVSAQTDPPTDGNWIVLDNTVVRDRHILLNGNLTVGPQGHLTLENVSLELNNTFPGRYYILVGSGGWMIVTDKDHDPTTKADASMVYSRRPYAQYSWRCSVDSVLRISASTVRYCGLSKGIVIETHDAMIDNSTISDGYYGVYVEDGSVQIYDSTIKDCWAGGIYIENGNAVVEGCTVMNNTFDGIMAIQNSDIIVRNSTL